VGSTVVIILFAALLVATGVLMLWWMGQTGGRQLNVERYRSQWLEIEGSLSQKQPASYQMAILNADKLLDRALRERGYRGNTMGERLKTAGSAFGNINAVWAAHKLRNRIAHETDVNITYTTARRALATFKQALKDLGAI
jgi:hypothetical protein